MIYRFKTIYNTSDNIELHYSQGFKKIFQHKHDFYEFCIALKDGVINYVDNRPVLLKNHESLFIKPQNQHTISMSDGSEINILNISFASNFFEDCWEYLFNNRNIDILQEPIMISDRRLNDYQQMLLTYNLQPTETKRYLEKKIVLETIFLFYKQKLLETEKNIIPYWLENVISYFKNPDNYTKGETLETVYKLAGYSKPQFNKLFKMFTGKTPIAYYNHCKIDEAKRLLASTNLSVEHITYYLGFTSTAHFIHLFKAISGESPSKYRKKYYTELS